MDTRDIIVLGGGISGLSLAFYCARSGMNTLVLEPQDEAGGAFHSHRSRQGESDFWIEMGAHTCYNSYGNLLEIMESCGTFERMVAREKVPFKVLVDNQVRSIFSQVNLLELAVSAPKILVKKREGESVESFYSSIVGQRNYRKLFRHFFNAVPSQETDQFPADLLFKTRDRRKDVMRSYTFNGGLQTVTDMMAAFDGVNVKTGEEAARVERTKEGFAVQTVSGNEYASSALAIATPVHVASRLLEGLHPELSSRLATIETASVHSVGVVVRKSDVGFSPVAGIVSPDDLFFSAVSRDTVFDDHFRGFTFHFRPEVTEENRQVERICQVLGVGQGDLQLVVRRENILPSLKVGHEDLHSSLTGLLTDPNLLVTGNYFGGVAIEDCVSRSLSEFNRLVQ